MDDTPTTKPAILERNRTAADALDRAVKALTDDQMLAAPPGEGWSPRDTLAHIAADLRWFAAQLEAIAEGREPTALEAFGDDTPPDSAFDLSTQDGRNAAQHERNRGLSLDDVRSRWAEYRQRVASAIERIPGAEFTESYAIVDLGHVGHVRRAAAGEEGFPLWQWIRGVTWHHFEDHRKDFEAATAQG